MGDDPTPRRPAGRGLRVPPSRPRDEPRGLPRGGVDAVRRLTRAVGRRPDAGRFGLALVLSLFGLLLAGGGAIADLAFHRGVETGGQTPWVRHPSGRDLATNVDLTRFNVDDLDAVAAVLQQSGFRYVRQGFSWAEIEPTRGSFAWERYDAIVDALGRHFIEPVAVLHRSPAWVRAPEQADAFDAPPRDGEDFRRFVEAVVTRYRPEAGNDRRGVPFVQIWDLPNRADRWGGAAPDATAYATLLSLGFNAARAVNPNATVVLAELDPQPRPDPAGDDLAFLGGVYRAGGAAFFDVVAAAVDGGDRSPFDRGVDVATPSLSRATLIREAMAAAGDEAKPVWATHYGWRAGGGPGAVVPADQAAYAVAGLQRARAEWPWMGPMFAWGLVPGPGLDGEVEPGRALLGADAAATPLYDALAAFAADGETAAAPTGFLPVDARQFVYEGNWELQHLGSTTYRTTREDAARTTVRFVGTGVVALLRLGPETGKVAATLDGEPIAVSLDAFQARDVPIPLAQGLDDRPHELIIELDGPGQLTVGGLEVVREVPMRWPMALLIGGGIGLVFLGLRDAVYTVAERTGRLQRRRGVELWPELPSLGDWRPARRA